MRAIVLWWKHGEHFNPNFLKDVSHFFPNCCFKIFYRKIVRSWYIISPNFWILIEWTALKFGTPNLYYRLTYKLGQCRFKNKSYVFRKIISKETSIMNSISDNLRKNWASIGRYKGHPFYIFSQLRHQLSDSQTLREGP